MISDLLDEIRLNQNKSTIILFCSTIKQLMTKRLFHKVFVDSLIITSQLKVDTEIYFFLLETREWKPISCLPELHAEPPYYGQTDTSSCMRALVPMAITLQCRGPRDERVSTCARGEKHELSCSVASQIYSRGCSCVCATESFHVVKMKSDPVWMWDHRGLFHRFSFTRTFELLFLFDIFKTTRKLYSVELWKYFLYAVST